MSSPCRTTSLLVSKESDGRIFHDPREKEDVLSLKIEEQSLLHLISFFLSTFSLPFCLILPFTFLFFFSFLLSPFPPFSLYGFFPFFLPFFSFFSFIISPFFHFLLIFSSLWSFFSPFLEKSSFGQWEEIASPFPLNICVAISFPCFFSLFLNSLLLHHQPHGSM